MITEKMKTIQNLINSKFVYEADGKIDSWHILDLDSTKVYGDCDDYSVTVAYDLADRSILKLLWGIFTLKYIFWLTKTADGQKHVVLKYNKMYIDNIDSKWNEQTKHKKIIPFFFPLPLIKLLIGKFVKK